MNRTLSLFVIRNTPAANKADNVHKECLQTPLCYRNTIISKHFLRDKRAWAAAPAGWLKQQRGGISVQSEAKNSKDWGRPKVSQIPTYPLQRATSACQEDLPAPKLNSGR